MDPLLGGLLAGGANLLGSIFSSDTSAKNTQAQIMGQEMMQQQSESFNAGQAQLNRDFQQQMSSTAYQRSTADMKAAGLNPMMMFGSGGPASVPGGSSASIGTPTMPTPQRTSPFAGLGDAVSKSVATAVSMKTMDRMAEEIANIAAETRLRGVQTGVEGERAGLIRSETGKVGAETATERERAGLVAAQKTVEQNAAVTARNLMDMDPTYRGLVERAGKYGEGISKAMSPALDTLNSASSFAKRFWFPY